MNKEQFAVSIIIPTLNEEKYLGILLDGLVEQSFNNFEVVVCDGGSTDKTEQVAQSFSQKLNLQFVKCPQRGVAHQRNYGASLAKHAYLMFIDSDGYIKPNFLLDVEKYIAGHPKVDMFVTWALPLNNQKIYRAIFYSYNIIFMDLIKNIRPVVQMGGFIFTKKSVFEKLGGYDAKHAVGEDHDLIERAFNNKFVVKLLRKPVVYTSVRRLEKEGLPKYLYNIAKATFYHLNGGISDEIAQKGQVDYKMDGGSYYDDTPKKIE